MSMLDNITDEALLGDDDELDYDLEKDEEDALLADPDNYDDNNYEDVPEDHDENVDEQYDGQGGVEEESDVLDIDVNVALEEAEEDIIDQSCVKSENLAMTICKTEVEDCGSDQEQEEQKARDRFLNERNNVIKRSNSNTIPDTLDKVNVKPAPLLDNRNIKFQRGNRGRGRGRPNHGRGSVFGRVGILPQEGKTVLINPHFRGNVKVNENARLVWDATNPNGHYQPQQSQRGYGNPQMAHVAPFQSQYNHSSPSPWVNPPFAVDPPNTNNNNNSGCNFTGPPPAPMHHGNFPEPPSNYNQPPELINNGIRPLMSSNTMPFNQQHHNHNPPHQQQPQQQPNQMASWNEDQCYGSEPVYPAQVGNFRGREVRYIQPLLAAPTFNNPQPQQQHAHFSHGRANFNNTFNDNHPPAQQQQGPPRRPVKPYINPHHPQAPVPQTNYHQPQHFDQPPPYIQQQPQFAGNQQHLPNHPPFQPHNQQQAPPTLNQPPAYDSYDHGGFNGNNQYPNQQFQSPQAGIQQQQQQNSPSNNGFQPANSYQQQHGFENNFNQQACQGQFNQQHYNNNNNRHAFGQNNRMQNNQHQSNQQQNHRQPMNNYNNTTVNRSPPKRRSFDNNQGPGDRDVPKKKKRSMEPGNLHEVPTVDMPDTTTEDKIESEDEETKAYRLKIEEQKRKREEFLRAKEERRKMAAAQRAEGGELLLGDAPESSVDTSVKAKPICTVTVKQQPLLKQPPIQQLHQGQQMIRQQQQQQQMRVKPQGFVAQQPGLMQHPPQFKPAQQLGFKQPLFRQPGPQQRPLQRVNSQGVRRIPVQQQQRANNTRNVPQPRRIIQQANIVVTQKNEPQQRVVLLKQPPAQMQKVQGNNRRVVLKGVQQQQQQANSEQANLSSFLSNRKVVTNSSDIVSSVAVASDGAATVVPVGTAPTSGGGALIETPVVVVSNLAAGTTDLKIRKLCQGLGPIQNIELIPNSRQATIRFKNIISAHKFFKKYQRKIVDLSMIQVCLIAES